MPTEHREQEFWRGFRELNDWGQAHGLPVQSDSFGALLYLMGALSVRETPSALGRFAVECVRLGVAILSPAQPETQLTAVDLARSAGVGAGDLAFLTCQNVMILLAHGVQPDTLAVYLHRFVALGGSPFVIGATLAPCPN